MYLKRLYIILLVFATSMIVVSTVLPHHHHEDGHICLLFSMNEHSAEKDEPDGKGCTDNCLVKLSSVDASSLNHHVIKMMPVVLTSLLSFFPEIVPDILKITSSGPYYLERLHSILLTCSAGLRAPPCFVA